MASATKTARRARRGLDVGRTDSLNLPGGNTAKIEVTHDEQRRTLIVATVKHADGQTVGVLNFIAEPAPFGAPGYRVYETVSKTVLNDLLGAVRNWVNDVG